MTRRPRKAKRKSPARATAKRQAEARPISRQRCRKGNAFIARLTIDVTPDLRARIKIMAFERGVTVAYMLRRLFLKEFPRTSGRRR